MKSLYPLIPAFATILFFVSATFAQPQSSTPAHITILHVNDTYQFTPVESGTLGGLARVMTIKKEALKENPNTLFMLAGDTLSPSVETRTYRGVQMIDAWNALGLDYAVFGNHEFDLKTPELLQRMKESKFPWLGANVVYAKTGKRFADTPPYIIRKIDGVKIGIIGLLLPETKETSSMDATLEVKDFCTVAKLLVPQIRKAGARVVVGLTHMFMREDKQLAACAQLDLILGGHEHTLLQSSANGTPIFKMTADAREVGKYDLYIDRKTGRLASMDWEVIPVNASVQEDPDFAPVIAKYSDLLKQLSVQVGSNSVILDALSLSNRTKETNVGNFIADSYRAATNADVALVNGGSIRADLTYNPGILTKRAVLSILPFNNPVVKIEISGKTLIDALEHGVARSAEDKEPGRFPQISGMSFKFDARKLPGQRVSDVMVGGRPVDLNKTYTLATSNFLVANGGDGYTMFKNARVVISEAQARKDSEVFEEAIRNAPNSTISPVVEGRIIRIN
ncbi:MAG: bifunctional metallophosphatase/5'-nucleotidase [Acidobacteria bacterium]|nr:MAG: bifunctional metallophosphatase/5'-nucleotidase [Acidobacteriota bacterium]